MEHTIRDNRYLNKILIICMTFLCCCIVPSFASFAEEGEAHICPSRSESLQSGNHVFFYNMGYDRLSGDMILLESNGRWGLIDAGHRYADTIADEDGSIYRTDVSSLSCQAYGRNGRDAMAYMVQTLGVDHLDFIIATHAHSDHTGGIPEIANLLIYDFEGEPKSLIDDTTVYFYKSYHHTGAQDDDLGPDKIPYSWHNQAFNYQAIQSVTECGGLLVDVSCGVKTKEGRPIEADQSINLSIIGASDHFENTSYNPRSVTNPFDDVLTFVWGDMKIDLYHLFAVEGATNDNVNSIVTVITCNGQKVFLAGDLNTQFQTEQKLATVIIDDHGHFDLVKMSHHGYINGSNSKDVIDSLQPRIMIATNYKTDLAVPSDGGVYSSVKSYASRYYGTVFYGTGPAERMLDTVLEEKGVSIFNIRGEGLDAVSDSAECCRDSLKIKNGWSKWGQSLSTNETFWFYFSNNNPVTGWKQINGSWYFFDQQGFMLTGWIKSSGQWYYLDSDGAMATGWQKLGGTWYYLKSNGAMATGWQKLGGTWYYLKSSGAMATGWQKLGGTWYYLKSSGAMATGWQKLGDTWYYFKSSGAMATGWQKLGGTWYYLKSSGAMATGWQKVGGTWYYLKGSGAMATGRLKIGSKWYRFARSGAWIN